jgi:hypothetical protein
MRRVVLAATEDSETNLGYYDKSEIDRIGSRIAFDSSEVKTLALVGVKVEIETI